MEHLQEGEPREINNLNINNNIGNNINQIGEINNNQNI
jgi:hypothetical protein